MHTHTHLYTDILYTSVYTHSHSLIYSISIPHHHNICIHPYVNMHIYPYTMYHNYICIAIYTRFHIHINTQHSHHTQTCIFSPFLHTYIHIKYTHSHIFIPTCTLSYMHVQYVSHTLYSLIYTYFNTCVHMYTHITTTRIWHMQLILHVCTETKSPQVHSYTNSSTCTHRST